MKRLVLVGGGHAHLHVLERFATGARQAAELILVSPARWQYYSGMLPGWMTGLYAWEQCRIDLKPLALAANARVIERSVVGIDAQRRCISLGDGGTLQYDLLSLDIGSESDLGSLRRLEPRLTAIRPLAAFAARWRQILDQADNQANFRLAVIGGGAAGVELALNARHALNDRAATTQVTLVSGEAGVLPGFGPRARELAIGACQRSGVEVVTQRAVGSEDGLLLSNGEWLAVDHVIAATGARAQAWLSRSGLALDDRGFVSVDPCHRSLSHPEVFAAGDVCSRSDTRMTRSGVNAVRAGPVLAHNLLAALTDAPLKPYRPRRHQLCLLATGNRRAIAAWGRLGAEGRWVWHWKDMIDRRFVARFSRPAEGTSDV